MNRVVKFRAWIKGERICNPSAESKWVYGYYMKNESYGDMPHALFEIGSGEFIPVIPE